MPDRYELSGMQGQQNAEPALGIDIGLANIPESHANLEIDPASLTTEGIIKACPRFAEIAAVNPKLAENMAERAVQSMKEEAAMKRDGMDNGTIKSNNWAAKRERHKQKATVDQNPEPMAETTSKKELSIQEPSQAESAIHNKEPGRKKMEQEQAITTAQVPFTLQPEQVMQQPIEVDDQTAEEPPATSESLTYAHEAVEQQHLHIQPEVVAPSQPKAVDMAEPRLDRVASAEQVYAVVNEQRYEVEIEQAVASEPDRIHTTIQAENAPEIIAKDITPETVLVFNIDRVEGSTTEESAVIEPQSDTEVAEMDQPAADSPTDSLDSYIELYDTAIQPQAMGQESEVSATATDDGAEGDAEWPLELLYESETVKTYRELLVMTADSETARISEGNTTEAEMDAVSIPEVALDRKDSSVESEAVDLDYEDFYDFAALVEAQPKTEKPVTMELIIKEAASERPLEQTFIHLAEVLSGAEQQPGQNEMRQILQHIAADLPACYVSQEETQEVQITPEMTKNVLMLLRELGYEHPGEALTGFAGRRGLAHLLQALAYMSQLGNEADRKEILPDSYGTSADEDEDMRLRIGKILFGLISKLNFEPVS